MKRLVIAVSVAAAAFLAACVSTPERNDQLEQARAQVQTLSQDPLATQAASRELQAARSELAQAETALEKREPEWQVNHLAYLALRHAEIGQARVAEARAREQIAQAEAERNRVLLQARTREAERATQQAHTAQAAAQMQAQDAQAARQEAAVARAETETALATAESIAQQLAALQAEETKRGMVMTLSDVLFDTGAATLKPGADLALGRLASFLEQNPQVRIIIEGHTDSRGGDAYNEELSRRRGQAVSEALAARGITPDRVVVVGRGEVYPVANNTTAEGRQQNRRVEIIFSDQSGRFAQGVQEGALR